MVQGIQLFLSNLAGQAGGGGSLGRPSSRVALAEACDVACDTAAPALGARGAARWAAWARSATGAATAARSPTT